MVITVEENLNEDPLTKGILDDNNKKTIQALLENTYKNSVDLKKRPDYNFDIEDSAIKHIWDNISEFHK